uniref:Deacetylvindoline O-acetyltransferase n=1 Tax=Aegilops tauschii TaxID=37682 RepID=N1QWP4_AEGTA
MAVDGFGEVGIRVVSRRLVKASDPSIQPQVVPLSNLDLYVGNVQVAILCLYPKPPAGRDFAGVVATFESLLPALLNEFYPFAGRIGTNPSSGLPELLCQNQGAELIVGEVGVALGSLDYGLADKSLKKLMLPYAEDVTFSVQLLSFACGSFSVLWATNHLVGDGHDNIRFLRMWSELARTGKIVADGGDGKLSHDRSVFRPRNRRRRGERKAKPRPLGVPPSHPAVIQSLARHRPNDVRPAPAGPPIVYLPRAPGISGPALPPVWEGREQSSAWEGRGGSLAWEGRGPARETPEERREETERKKKEKSKTRLTCGPNM